MASKIVRLLAGDGSWGDFEADWRAQCSSYGEEFDSYAEGTFSVVRDLIDKEKEDAGVYAFYDEDHHISMCQVNVAGLPGYDSPVMRVRFLTLSPDFDFGDKSVDEYAIVLVTTLAGILALSDAEGTMKARHIKFHLSSPADRQFFATLGRGLDEAEEFTSVTMRGAWLYITKA